MKRVLTFLVLLLSVVAVYAGGIKNAKDLAAFAKAVNKGESISAWQNDQGVVCLEADINMSKMKKWTPIKTLACTFDGQGHALLNWKTKCGLFELVEEKGIVQNLRIDASCSMNVSLKDEVVVGFIAHINKGTIQNCENGGSITYKGGYTEQHIYIGGLAGQNGRTIRDSRNSGIISAESTIASANKSLNILVGGIAGSTVPKGSRVIIIYRCENKAPITVKSDAPRIYVGGIIGYSGRAGLRYCTNSGGISATGSKGNAEAKYYSNVGGITGQTGQHIQRCDNFGRIYIDGPHISYAGGVTGSLNAVRNIVGCSNYGEVISTCAGASNFAGIIGASGDGVHLCNCNNYGAVSYKGSTAPKGTQLGGIAGYIFSKKNTKFGTRLLQQFWRIVEWCCKQESLRWWPRRSHSWLGGCHHQTRGLC